MNPPNTPESSSEDQPHYAPPEEIEVTNLASAIEALLRNPLSLLKALPEKRQLILPLFLLALFSASVLGLVFGSYSAGAQLWAAPLLSLIHI